MMWKHDWWLTITSPWTFHSRALCRNAGGKGANPYPAHACYRASTGSIRQKGLKQDDCEGRLDAKGSLRALSGKFCALSNAFPIVLIHNKYFINEQKQK